ncbi:MAG: phosphoribosylanthranilate isomerase, partial [Candidatus Bathyarchaeota archaeon]|nr:phosphoribosylanthranilate isomerase [Candidatus Bathyarchaeota archaeon]
LERTYKKLEPRIIQVHGLSHLYKDVRKRLRGVRLICAIQAKADKAVNIAVKAAETCDAVLLDTYVSGRHGGTGKVHDWKLSRRVREAIHPKPLILAGGLTPKNVKDAIRVVKPYAVDVSSGVESSPGTKDPDKVFEFIRNAKEVEI